MVARAAVIGCGLIGAGHAFSSKVGVYSHTEAYSICPGTRLAAVCDSDPERARAAGDRWGVPAFADSNRLFAETKPEIVSICTPDATHADIVRTALEVRSVRAVLAEKPLATSLADARMLADLARRRGVVLAVNYSRRYAPGHQKLAERLKAGLIGDIVRFHGYYNKGTRHSGTHWFDWVRMLAGEIVMVQGYDHLKEDGPDPTLDARLRLANGAEGTLAALDCRRYSLFELELVGTTGRLQITDSGHSYRLETVGDSPWYSGYRTLLPMEQGDAGFHDTLLHAVRDLSEALEYGRPPACTAEDGIAALEVAEALLLSASSGQPHVFVPDRPAR